MSESLYQKLKEHRNKVIAVLFALLALDFVIWARIYQINFKNSDLQIYFLDVGQGDSQLVILPGGVKVLIDGGPPNGELLQNLEKILPLTDRYIDLVMMSHAQLDHFGGLIEVIKRYRVGAFLWNGREGTAKSFFDLQKAVKDNNVQVVVLEKGDKISYAESYFDILWPNQIFLKSKELNDTCLVAELVSKNSKTLFTGDIGENIESELLRFFNEKIDILKVPHHGSKFSSSDNFLEILMPKLAFIEVGAKNTYGHPTKETLERLANVGTRIYRTDEEGTIKALINGKTIKVLK